MKTPPVIIDTEFAHALDVVQNIAARAIMPRG
jgi:hypothetical protein